MLDVNTVSGYPTHFLRAVELIHNARKEFAVPSENWPNPTEYKFGVPNEHYYAEIWTDGMDWQPSYWIIEEHSLRKPEINPLIIFESHEDRILFREWYFKEFIKGILWYRRDLFWVQHNDLGYYTDSTWPYLFRENKAPNKYNSNYCFEHVSQPEVKFWLNFDFIPKEYRYKIYSKEYRRKYIKEVNKS